MPSKFESKCTFTLVSCFVSWLGLFLLQDQCSGAGIAITCVGLVGIGAGIRMVIADLVPQITQRISRAGPIAI